MPSEGSATVSVTTKVRRMWALRVAGWFLTLPRVVVYANGKKLGKPQAIPFSVKAEDVEVGKVESGRPVILEKKWPDPSDPGWP